MSDPHSALPPPPPCNPNDDKPGIAAGAFFLLIALFGWWAYRSNAPLRETFGAPGLDPGPAMFPVLVLAALGLGGLWLVLSGLWRRDPGLERLSAATLGPHLAFILSAGAAAHLMPLLGYVAPTTAFALAWLAYLTPGPQRGPKGLALLLGLALAMAVIIQAVFVHLLRVPLP